MNKIEVVNPLAEMDAEDKKNSFTSNKIIFEDGSTNHHKDIATVTQAAVGTNVTALIGTPNASGNAGSSILNTSPAATDTFPLRVVAVVPETEDSATTFTEVMVKINLHQFNTILGNAVA